MKKKTSGNTVALTESKEPKEPTELADIEIDEQMWQVLEKEVASKISSKRYKHTLRVVKQAEKLAKHYNYPLTLPRLAALFHDYAKELPASTMQEILQNEGRHDILELSFAVWHAPVGAYLVREKYEFGELLFEAIYNHTTGRVGMTTLEKITFLADYTEPVREFDGVEEVRKLIWKDLDKAMYAALNYNLDKLVNQHLVIAKATVDARNYLLLQINKKNKGKGSGE